MCAGNDGTGKRCAKEIDVLVDGVASDGWVAKLFDKLYTSQWQLVPYRAAQTHLSAKILNVTLAGTDLESLLFRCFKVFLLAYIGHECNDIVSFVLLYCQINALKLKATNESVIMKTSDSHTASYSPASIARCSLCPDRRSMLDRLLVSPWLVIYVRLKL